MEHINQNATMKTNFSASAIDAVLINIKLEHDHIFNDLNFDGESSDLEDSASIVYQSIDNGDTKQQNETYESAFTFFEKNANDESSIQEHTDTELVDSEIISMHASSSISALPIMSITPSTFTPHTCHQCCLCDQAFCFIDRPSHISEIPSIDEQNKFLKLGSSLSVNSCFCALCWKMLEKYKVQRESSGNCVQQNISSNKTLARTCSIHFCSQPYFHKMSVDQCELVKKIISTFKYCDIFTMSSCQICSSILNEPLTTGDWSMYKKWNLVYIQNNLCLILPPGMFICMTCRGYISKINISESNATRLELYGKSQYNFNIRQRSTNVKSPIVVAKIKDKNDYVCSTKVKFPDPLTTATYHYEYDYDKNDTESMTSSALLNVDEKNLCTSILEPIDEEQHLLTFTPSNHVLGHDDNKDLLQTGDYLLINYDSKISKNKEINRYPEIVKNEPEIIDSHQVINVHDEIENNQSRLNSHILSSGAQDKSSSELKEGNQCMNEIDTNYKAVHLNETDNKMYSFIAAVEPPNPVSIKRKQSDVIYHSISNKNVKKQRLNEKYSSCDNNFTNDRTTKSYRDNIPHQSINSPSILNMNSELIGVQNLSNDVDEESFKIHGNSMKNIELKTNEPSIEIIKTYSSNPSCSSSSSLQFQYVFKNNSTWKEPIKSSIKKVINVPLDLSDLSDTGSIPETIILSDSENLIDSEIRVFDTDESFSDSDNDKILSNVNKVETDFMIVGSEEDLDSDYDCEIITDPEIETNYKFVSDSENSVDVEIISNDKNAFECTTLLDSAKDSNCDITSDKSDTDESFSDSDNDEILSNVNKVETDFMIVGSEEDLDSDYDCEIITDPEIETNYKFVSDSENSVDVEIISNDKNVFECTTLLDSAKDSNCDITSDESFSDSDNDEILSNVNKVETDFMIVGAKEDLDSDYDCEIITDPEIQTNYKFVSDSENSVDVEIISNDKNLFECTTLLDSAKDSNCDITSDGVKKSRCIIVSDTKEKFNSKKISTFKVIKTGSDSEILMNHAKIIETYIKTVNGKVNYIVAFDNEIKPSGDKVSTCIVISDNTTGFNNKKLSTYKINVEKGSDCKIFLDGEKIKIVSEKDNKNVIVFNGEIEHSNNKELKCLIISDSVKEYTNKNISTFKIVSNVQKNPACEILNGKEIFGIESGNRKIKYMILSDESNSDEQSQYMISDDGEDFNSKKLSAFKIMKKNIQKGSDSVLLGGEESHKILPNGENGRIKCMIAPDDEIESDSDEQSDNGEIFSYKKVSDVIITSNSIIEVDDSQGEQSDEEEFNAKKIPDTVITSNSTIQFDDSQSLKTLVDNNSINNSKINTDKRSLQLQIKSGHSFPYLELNANENGDQSAEKNKELTDYFQPYLTAITYYFENSHPSLKELYIRLNRNAMDMLLYLLENYRMVYNEELLISKTADEYSIKYLTEQKTILNNYFGNPKDSINASKPFIHPSSHLHQYSKRLSPNVGPLIIKDITITTGSPVQNNNLIQLNYSIASKVQTQFSAYGNPNIQFPVAIKKKTVFKNKLKNSQLQ